MARKRHLNNAQLALDILRGRWLLSDAEALLPSALGFLSRTPADFPIMDYTTLAYGEDGDYDDADNTVKGTDKKVIVIPMHGSVTKYWSCATVGTVELANDLVGFAKMDEVVGIVLDIDSPGGAANAVPPMIEAIKKVQEMGKPIIVHGDSVASAAYWIASQCDAVFLDNRMSEAGSIGAYAQFIDDRENIQTGRRIISVYAPESGDKNRAYREALDGRYGLCQEELSELVREFHAAVKAGRPKLDTEAGGVLSGAMFLAPKAVDLGLADGIKSLAECVENVFIRAEFK